VATLVLSLAGFVVGLALHASELKRHSRQLEAHTARQAELLQQANEATSLAGRREDEVAELLYASDMRLGGRAWREGDARVLHERLVGQLPGAAGVDRRDFAWHFLAGFDRPPQREARVSELPLYAAVMAPDGGRLAVGGHDGTVRILDGETLHEVESFDSGQLEVNGLSFSRGGNRLASAGQDGSIGVWELPGGRRLLRIAAHPRQAYHCVFADDDRVLVSCGQNDPQIRLWDAASGQAAGALAGHERDVEFITLAPNGTTLASAGTDGTARLWDVPSRALLHTLRKHEDRLTSVCFTQRGRVLATGGLDCRICVWNVESGRLLGLRALYDPVQSLTAAEDGAWVIAGDRGGALTILRAGPDGWTPKSAAPPDSVAAPRDLSAVFLNGDASAPGSNPASAPLLSLNVRAWPAHQGRIYSLTHGTQGVCLSAGEDGCIRQWSMDARTPVIEWSPPAGAAISMIADFSGAGGLLALAADDKVHLLRGPVDNFAALPVDLAGAARLRSATISEGTTLIGIAEDGHIRRWSWPQREPQDLGTLRTLSWPTDLAMSPDGAEFVTIDFGDNVMLWIDARTGKELASLETRDPRAVAWSADGRQIIVGALDDVLLINAREHTLLHKIATHRGPANCVAIHPGNRLVASGGSDRSVILTDIVDRKTAVLRGHRAIVTAATFSRDGRCLATGDDDGTIKLWHTATRQYLYDLAVDRGACSKLLFSADGRRLAALVEGKVLVFDTQSASDTGRDD
jgi:WD40 repeat protein